MQTPAAKYRGLRFSVFEADLALHELRSHGVRVKLSGQPFQALVMLLERPGTVVSRDDLRRALWPAEEWGDHDQRLNRVVNKIREVLNDSAETPRFIETLPRLGYRFLIPVEKLFEAEPELLAQPAEGPAAASPSARWPVAAISVLVVCGLALAIAYSPLAKRLDHAAPASTATPLTTFLGSELHPSFSPDGKQVAFSWDGEKQQASHIYVTPVAGGGVRRLTQTSRSDRAPVWAPDGRRIAFLRESEEPRAEIWLTQADTAAEHKIADITPVATDHPLAWTADARWLVVSEAPPADGPAALFLLSTETGERRRLTSPPVHSGGDLSPAVSRDGRKLAFTRSTGMAWREIFLATLSADLLPTEEPARVTDMRRVIDTLAWTPDGRELVFSAASTLAGARLLYRLNPAGTIRQPVEMGIEGVHPVISPDGGTLAYARKNIEQTSIWQVDLDGGAAPRQTRLLSSTRRDYTADISPDRKRLVFSSVRSGTTDIWISDVDGGNLKQITSLGASTPRWSPDGSRIAFESSAPGQYDVYVIEVANGALHRLTFDAGADLRPSWSRDGKYVYFCSNRTGKAQIWRVPSAGGEAAQVTRRGGNYAVETADGTEIYFTSTDQPAAIRRMPVNGGEEKEVISRAAGFSAIALARDGLCYLSSLTSNGAKLNFYRFATGESQLLATIDHPVHHFISSPPDGKSILYTQLDRQDSDLMLVKLR